MKVISAEQIAEAHKIEDVKVYGSLVWVWDGFKPFSFHYSDSRIAKAVAKKLLNFVGV